jgi:hypothetical protein
MLITTASLIRLELQPSVLGARGFWWSCSIFRGLMVEDQLHIREVAGVMGMNEWP